MIRSNIKNILLFKKVYTVLFLFELIRQTANFIVLNKNILSFVIFLSLGFLSNLLFLFTPYIFFNLRQKTYLYLISPVLILSNLIYLVHLIHLKAPFSIGAIAVIAETTPNESLEFFDTVGYSVIILSFILSILPILFLRFFLKEKELKIPTKAKFITILFASMIFFVFALINQSLINQKSNKNIFNPYSYSYVYHDLKQIAYYYREQKKLKYFIANRPNYKFEAKYKGTFDKYNVILIIGESLSKYHMQIYGYRRNTTPNLCKTPNLYAFKDVISPATQTRESIIRMLSLAKGKYEELFFKKGSIITAAKEGGYYVTWLSNQMILGISDTETSIIAKDANETKFINSDWNSSSLDEKLLPYFTKAIHQESHKKKMIVLHLLGNHFKYENRYPQKRKFDFRDDDHFESYLNAKHRSIINHYDNSVLYTDSILNEIIKITKQSDTPSIVLFLSDHGEEVFDTQELYIGHGSPNIRKEAVDIPFLIWASSDSLFTDDFNHYLNRKYSSQELFHTLADIMKLTFNDYDSKKSIISPFFEEKERKVLNSNNELINYKKIK